jgi:twitching motility protein PilT
MRDLETTAIAIETAATGHLVFATLHTTSAPATIERLVDQFPADQQSQIRLMLADSLRAVISQNLLKKKGGGRVAAYEILISTPAVANMIREGKTFQIPSSMQTGRKLGMRQLNDSLLELVEKDVVEVREAYAKATDREDLLNRLRAAGIETGLFGG